MEKVVYFLGAGFSAPLGLPVMTNFLVKSKDMYFQNQFRYARFPEVFNTIKRLSVSKNYYEADLFNIEEILSILEMRELLGEKAIKKSFIEYIKYRFVSGSVVDYLEALAGEQVTYGDPLIKSLPMNKLEDAHNRFFDVKHDR